MLHLCHNNLVLYSLISGKSHPNKIPTNTSLKMCHWYVTATELCILHCMQFMLVDQCYQTNGF